MSTEGEVIRYHPESLRWRLLRDGHPIATSVRREVLERKHPGAIVEEHE